MTAAADLATRSRAGGIPAGRPRIGRRGALVAVGVVVLLGILVALILAGGSPQAYLDPEDTGRYGTEALAEVLRGHGVEVDVVRGVHALAGADISVGTTVVVGDPQLIGAGAAGIAASLTRPADRVVLLDPTQAELSAFAVPATVTPAPSGLSLTAQCGGDIVRGSDTIAPPEVRFTTPERPDRPVTECFPLEDPSGAAAAALPADTAAHGAAMVTAAAVTGRPETVAIGFAEGLTNGSITEQSLAGVAVRALGGSPRLVWYQPEPGDLSVTASGGSTATDPWPAWQTPATVLVLAALVVLAVVRGRRLGRLVPEPLPVVVRAVETTESRGRLYRRAKDRDRAAAILRDAALRRLRQRLALAPAAPAGVVVPVVAAATGESTAEVGALLFGPPPTDDPGLLRLGQQLTDLEERARTP